jgi:phosphoribosylformylglycinamidine cyclo-ligase
VVGIVNNSDIVDGSEIGVGHQLIGLASTGLHSNGFSLVRKICFDKLKLKIDDTVDALGKPLAEELLKPTKIYSEVIHHLLKDFPIHGIAHITGGGMVDNLPRILHSSCKAIIREGSLEIPPIFDFLQGAGNLSAKEMKRTFNNGIGMVLAVPAPVAQDVISFLAAMDEKAYLIGEIVKRKKGEPQISWS